MLNPAHNETYKRPIEDQQYQKYWDQDKTQYHMRTTGFFAAHLDKKYGVGYRDIDKMSVNHQREIFKELLKNRNQKVPELKHYHQN